MACGRPVVASDWNGYKDLIEHGRSGFRVRTDWADCLGDVNEAGPGINWEQEHTHAGQSVSIDVGEMAAYISELLRNKDLRHTMGQRGRQRAEALYDWSVVIPQWEALWTELADIARSLSSLDYA
jgi:glycosyltransferase involved in cell wall biosynthesis